MHTCSQALSTNRRRRQSLVSFTQEQPQLSTEGDGTSSKPGLTFAETHKRGTACSNVLKQCYRSVGGA